MQKSRRSQNLLPGQKFNHWNLEEKLGSGGNGEVWKASKQGSQSVALKILKNTNHEALTRFKSETKILEELGEIPGIVPIIEKSIDKEGDPPWFSMPIATPFQYYIKNRTTVDIIKDFIELAETIEQLHLRKISHRDIKPANFLFFKNRLCLSDFGLAKYPNKESVTTERRDVGAKFTMAPEMRRTAKLADGLPADIYSLAKSLWIALTNVELGFDGQYTTTSTLALSNYLQEEYTTTLDQLLFECTENAPHQRPTISTFISQLKEWQKISRDFHARNLTEWTELIKKLFPIAHPDRSCWTNIDSIYIILSEISNTKSLNHMFYPTGGGDSIIKVSRATENGMIALHTSEKMVNILKPKKLTYESFGEDTSWSYFRLEAAPVMPSNINDHTGRDGAREVLTEISPGKYAKYECWENNEFNGQPLPESARIASRFTRGSFVFFSTRSTYNLDPSTYDGRHNMMTEDEFREYIAKESNNNKAK